MTSSQSADEERPAVAQAHMNQQLCKEVQEMKRRRGRRFPSQVTVDEAVVSYYSRSCRQLPFILLLTNLVQMLAGFTTEEPEADTVADQELKRVNRIFGGLNEGIWPKTEELTAKSESCSLDRFGGNSTGLMRKFIGKSSRKHLKPTTGQPAASISLPPAGQPDASNSTSSLDMESNRKKADVVESYSPDARYPVTVFEASAVAQRIQRNQRSRWKNQWLRLTRANCLKLREQDLYYSGK
ncbi:hypothetical protein F511_13566 [Dorcoceras hygrometricum]|uniref:Uncharacterized protein n=1 Tax=Dorcoceras hygrometricum TaxID=472368 RepID=A0A2Z7CXN8_9LAMI|nr:hypothetical protein F511_13566 [Dorcoceras hygrometricum]